MNTILNISKDSDSELTARAMAGQRDAFAQIVSRYQSLVCSLAYSATGNLSQSEDLAQETFIAAWKGLATLREPEKLRSWLCSIARNIIAAAVRKNKREPLHIARSLDDAINLPSPDTLPVERAISGEEESILWRSLERIPHMYREPLILFYREGQSIENVAQELELSEEAIKQRLSRGRRLLKMEVESFVESALRQSKPGREFTAAVLAGLPMASAASGIAAGGASSAKAAGAAKTASFAWILAGMLTPLLATVGGLLSLAASVKSARSERERSMLKKSAAIFLCIFTAGTAACFWFRNNGQLFTRAFIIQFIALLAVCAITAVLRKRIEIEEGLPRERTYSRSPFGNLGSRGFLLNMHAWLLVLIFVSPFSMLSVHAAKAHDAIALSFILGILAAAFMLCRYILIQKPERAIVVLRTIWTIHLPLLLLTLHLRWESWTHQSPWQLRGEPSILIVLGILFFVMAILLPLNKKTDSRS